MQVSYAILLHSIFVGEGTREKLIFFVLAQIFPRFCVFMVCVLPWSLSSCTIRFRSMAQCIDLFYTLVGKYTQRCLLLLEFFAANLLFFLSLILCMIFFVVILACLLFQSMQCESCVSWLLRVLQYATLRAAAE